MLEILELVSANYPSPTKVSLKLFPTAKDLYETILILKKLNYQVIIHETFLEVLK